MKKICIFTWRKEVFSIELNQTENKNIFVGYMTTNVICGANMQYRIECDIQTNICRIFLNRNSYEFLHECQCKTLDLSPILAVFQQEGRYIQTSQNSFVKVIKTIKNEVIFDRYNINENDIEQKTIIIPISDIIQYIPTQYISNIRVLNLDDVFALISKKDIIKIY